MKISNNPIPLYYQLETTLRSRLMSGEFSPDDSFPSEEFLCEQYGVSRITVRQALAELQKDGLISRKRGKGTFVTKNVSSMHLEKLIGNLDDAIFKGLAPKYEIQLLGFQMISVRKDIGRKLNLKSSDQVLNIKRIRFVGGKPIAFLENHIPREIGQHIHKEDVLKRPILNTLENKLHIHLLEAEQMIEAALADIYVGDCLQSRVGAPLLKVSRTAFDVSLKPVNHALILFKADSYSFRIRLRRNMQAESKDWSFL